VDYDPDRIAALWRATNNQDSRFSQLNHLGIANEGYRQGPYAIEEKLVAAFKDFYVDGAKAALEHTVR
jgi:glycine betaine catabolism A